VDDEELLLKRLLEEDEEAFEELVAGHDGALARQSGEEGNCQRELREAHRLFTEIGGTAHAERLAGELAIPAS
jgi:hypothetical protein